MGTGCPTVGAKPLAVVIASVPERAAAPVGSTRPVFVVPFERPTSDRRIPLSVCENAPATRFSRTPFTANLDGSLRTSVPLLTSLVPTLMEFAPETMIVPSLVKVPSSSP
ncbi:MAG: hypothetical protein JWN86_2583 [Planctomycetota bacterium]|nr:hypothetical protein [Planctomycetota bacterium]